jgi:hypothetical protein
MMQQLFRDLEKSHGKKVLQAFQKDWKNALNKVDRPTVFESGMNAAASGKYSSKQLQTFKQKQWQ